MLVTVEMKVEATKKQEIDVVKTFADQRKLKNAETKEKTGVGVNEEQAIIDVCHGINENVAKERTLISEIGARKKAVAEKQDNLAEATERRAKELPGLTDVEG